MGNHEGNEVGRLEKTLYTRKVITRNKAFFLDFKENNNGKFLKITESSGDKKRSFVFIPEEGLTEFKEALKEIIQEYVKL
ncbi:MAG: DNA-binding protein [bacterium]